MDGSSVRNQLSDRSRPSPFPRTASRSSTSSSNTKMSGRSGRPPTIDRPRSQLSREAPEHSRESLPAMSTFLQERLERERRVNESERSSSRASNDPMSASGDLRNIQSSPARKRRSEGFRPRSSEGEDAEKKKGLGLKEMEQTLSTLHKQNFDLKLELFHRREKQTALEERVEKLEIEKARTDEMNDQLIQELEKRDKAVEEAVAMIVVLEGRVEQLIREREMVRRVEQDGLFFARHESPAPESTPRMSTPRMKNLDTPKFDDMRSLSRMPSFLSEHSVNTANLRNVYLGVRGSVLSLNRTPEGGHEAERMEHNGVSSPTLSVLSESSFLSVYGQKAAADSSSPQTSPAPMDGPARNRGPSISESIVPARMSTPSKLRRSSGSRATPVPQQFQNIQDILDMGGSPLQRLERLEMALNAMGEASRPATSAHEREAHHQSSPAPPPQTQRAKTKQEKRDALQKVLTQGHQGRDFSNNGLPPTPDTISTSTLRRFQNSNDTLSREQGLRNEQSYLALSETTASQLSGYEGELSGTRLEPPTHQQTSQAASTTAFDSRKPLSENDGHCASPPIRPQSVGGTALSQQRRKDNWDSEDSDDEFASGVDSMASSFDPWLRESLKPNRPDVLGPQNSASQAGPNKQGRASPDLFSFPVNSGGWAADAMFGSLGGAAYMGSMGNTTSPPPMADVLDALGSSLPAPYFGSGLATPVIGSSTAPPPPPNRRSSLHAQTGVGSTGYGSGSIPASPARPSPMNSKLKKSPVRNHRNRSNSIDIRPHTSNLKELGLRQDRAMTVPPKQVLAPPPPSQGPQTDPSQVLPKQRHYPPTASQAPRSRGLNNLFRRSIGSAEGIQAATPSSAPPTETTFKNLPNSMMGLPSWGKRASLVEDDRESATPPPIMRNKAPPRLEDEGGGAPLEPHGSGGGAPIGNIPDVPATGPSAEATSNGAPINPTPRHEGGGKLKWLGLGRVSSLRKH